MRAVLAASVLLIVVSCSPPKESPRRAADVDAELRKATQRYADLSAFQLIAGLRYAFPRAMKREEAKVPRLVALHEHVAKRPRIAAYLASERRIPFNEYGIFRNYKELDA